MATIWTRSISTYRKIVFPQVKRWKFLLIKTNNNLLVLISLEYGGTQPPFDNTIWRQRILNNEEYFVKLESYNVEGAINNNNIDSYHHKNGDMSDEICDDEIFFEAEDDADDNKSLDVEIDSLHFIDTETEDSEEYDSDDRVLSPRKKAPPIESLEEMFLKHEFSTFTLKEQEFEEVKP